MDAKLKAVVFDLDGTLLDTLLDLYLAVNMALRTFGMPERTREEVRWFVGNGVRKLMQRAVPGGEDNPLFEKTFAFFRQYYLEHSLDHTQPYAGIEQALEGLKARGLGLAVVSNKRDDATQELCRHFFTGTIDVAIGENEEGGVRKKPAPDSVLAALRQLDCPTGYSFTTEAVYVGDSDVDIQTAANAKIPCISVLWGFRDREFLLSHGATTLIDKPSQLLSL